MPPALLKPVSSDNAIDRDHVKALKAEGLSTYKIAAAMGISRMSVHRILNG